MKNVRTRNAAGAEIIKRGRQKLAYLLKKNKFCFSSVNMQVFDVLFFVAVLLHELAVLAVVVNTKGCYKTQTLSVNFALVFSKVSLLHPRLLLTLLSYVSSLYSNYQKLNFLQCWRRQGQRFYVKKKKTSSSALSGFKNTRRSRVFLDPIKHVLRVF